MEIRTEQREIKRGDVYYIKSTDSLYGELSSGRPAIVISSNFGNERSPVCQCVLMTTAPRDNFPTNVRLTTPARKGCAVCNQIYTYSKSRFTEYMCTLSDEEMSQIDMVVADVLGLKLYDEDLESEFKAEAEEEMKRYDAEIEKLQSDIDSHRVEIEMYKKMYEKAIEMLAELKISGDLRRAPVVEVAPVEEEPQPEAVDLNSCSEHDLRRIGFDARVAKMVIAARPFESVEELRYVNGVTRIGYQLVEKRVTVKKTVPKKNVVEKPKNVGKVNVNTATKQEIIDGTGLSNTTAGQIVSYRKKHGNFSCLEELCNVDRFGERCLKKYGDKMTV